MDDISRKQKQETKEANDFGTLKKDDWQLEVGRKDLERMERKREGG